MSKKQETDQVMQPIIQGSIEIEERSKPKRVVVIGAGIAGLAAARELIQRGYSVLLLEARRRPGGRLKTVPLALHREVEHASDNSSSVVGGKKSNGVTAVYGGRIAQRYRISMPNKRSDELCLVDAGGQFIHGTEGNPIADLAFKLGVTCTSVDKSYNCLLLNSQGWPVEVSLDAKVEQKFNYCLDLAFRICREDTDASSDIDDVAGLLNLQKKSRRKSKRSPKLSQQFKEAQQQQHPGASSFRGPLLKDTERINDDDDEEEEHENNEVKSSEKKKEKPPSFGDIFYDVAKDTLSSLTAEDKALFDWHTANLEMSCGVNLHKLGKQWNDDEQYGYNGSHVALKEGFGAVVSGLTQGVKIRYGTVVSSVRIVTPPQDSTAKTSGKRKSPKRRSSRLLSHQQPKVFDINRQHSTVVVSTNQGTIECDSVIVTVPLGILKENRIAFDPPLPKRKRLAIERLGFGVLNKCILTFEAKFWPDVDFIGHCSKVYGENILLFNVSAEGDCGAPWISFMFGGAYALKMEQFSDKRIVSDCCEILAKCCGLKSVPTPIDYLVTRWKTDPFSRGSFSYIPPGVSVVEYDHLSSPIIDPLDEDLIENVVAVQSEPRPRPVVMFAGEATSAYHPSTIHGAYLSGLREAHRLDFAVAPIANHYKIFCADVMYKRSFPIRKQLNPSATYSAESQRQLLCGSNSIGELDTDGQHQQHKSSTTTEHSPLPTTRKQQQSLLDKRRPGLRSRSRYVVRGTSITIPFLVSDTSIVQLKAACDTLRSTSRRMVHLKTNSEIEEGVHDNVGNRFDVNNKNKFNFEKDRAFLRGVDSFGSDLKGMNLIRHKMGVVADPKALQARYKELVKAGGDLYISEIDTVDDTDHNRQKILDWFATSMPNNNVVVQKTEILVRRSSSTSTSNGKKRRITDSFPKLSPPPNKQMKKEEEKSVPNIRVAATTTRFSRQSIAPAAAPIGSPSCQSKRWQHKNLKEAQVNAIKTRSRRSSIPTREAVPQKE